MLYFFIGKNCRSFGNEKIRSAKKKRTVDVNDSVVTLPKICSHQILSTFRLFQIPKYRLCSK